MTAVTPALDSMTMVVDVRDFDPRSGNALERFVFNHRLWVLAACALLTLLLAPLALKIPVNASFEKMIPQSHPYIRNYFDHQDSLRGMSNSVRIVLENPAGDIFDRDFLLAMQKVNDEVFLIPGVDRSWMRSLWTPSLRWTEVTEEGWRGGPVMPDNWDGSPPSMKQLRTNIFDARIAGNYVGDDLRSAMIVVPLLGKIQDTGQPIDYRTLSRSLEAKARALEGPKLRVRLVGFAKVVGDLVAARYTFRRLFMAGLAALLTNVVGFAVLMVIDIPVIQGLAVATSVGVCILIFTKLLLVPVALSYTGVSPRAAARSVRAAALDERAARSLWSWLAGFTERPRAGAAVLAAIVLAAGGHAVRTP